MKNLFLKISNNIVKYLFTLFCILYATCNILFSYWINNVGYEKSINIGINFLCAGIFICFSLVLFFLIKNDFFKIQEKHLLIGFLSIAFITGILWIFINDPILRNHEDSINCFNTALSIYNGSLSSLKQGTYICIYPNNLGLVTYELLHIYLFGEYYSLYSIRVVNLLFTLFG